MVKVTMKTKFLNSKRRAIFESKGSKGKVVFFSMGENGIRRYAPKARFHQNAEGKVHTVKANNVIPAKLRLAKLSVARKVRSNKGVKRGPYGPRKAPANKAPAAPRKVRSNKGVKRGPRMAMKKNAPSPNASPLTAGAKMLLKMNAEKRRPVTRSMARKA